MNQMMERISAIGIIPVIKIEDVDKAVPLAQALCKGGLPAAEITFRTEQAEEAIRRIAEQVPEMLVGAGTVLTTEQADKAAKAGARFIVSPGFNPVTVAHCQKIGVPILPGCSNPSDIEQAISFGLEVVKFFPAEASGGLKMIKAMSAPYHQMKFMPTGGINASNLREYLDFDQIIACGGSWMVSEELIQAGNFDEITRLTQEAVRAMLGFQAAHIGINAENMDEARNAAALFGNLLNLPVRETPISVFSGAMIEVIGGNGRGEKGHVAVSCNHVGRAIAYLKMKGIAFAEDSIRYHENGRPSFAYLQDEILGFAVHLIEKQ